MNHIDLEKIHKVQNEYLGDKKPVNNIQPIVSVWVVSYQHVNYISESLEGILMQKTDFPIEIVLGEDESTDGTRDICKQYAEKYTDKIRLFLRDRKQTAFYDENGRFIRSINARLTGLSCRGKYIAMCEGDDYWTDPLKLQKQVDFLESHDEFSLVCHDALIVNEMTGTSSLFFGPTKRKQICSTKDTLNVHFCPTASIMFRTEAILPLSNFSVPAAAGDHFLVQMASLKGLIYRMFDVMSVYRKTASGASEINGGKNLVRSLENRINTLNHLNKVSNYKYQKNIKVENLLIKNRINLLNSTSKFRVTILKLNRKVLSYIKRFL